MSHVDCSLYVPKADRVKIDKCRALLASPVPGERQAARAAIGRIYQKHGLDPAGNPPSGPVSDLGWGPVPKRKPDHEVAFRMVMQGWPTRWREAVELCLAWIDSGCLRPSEPAFLHKLAAYKRQPSPKQLQWLGDILARLLVEAIAGTAEAGQ